MCLEIKLFLEVLYIDGKRRNFARLKLIRDDVVVSVEPIDGYIELFPSNARIVKDPYGVPLSGELHFCMNERRPSAKTGIINDRRILQPTAKPPETPPSAPKSAY